MSRRIISLFLLISFGLNIFTSCSNGDLNVQKPVKPELTLEERLEKDPDAKALMQIRDDIIQRGYSRGIKGYQIKAAYIANDVNELNKLFAYSEEEVKELSSRIKALTQSLLTRYPELKEEFDRRRGEVCLDCDIDEITAKWDRGLMIYEGKILYSPEREPVRCRWINLVIDLSFCLLMPHPVLWAMCTYRAVCGNCEGGALDVICP